VTDAEALARRDQVERFGLGCRGGGDENVPADDRRAPDHGILEERP
jgi:hypothetical protein